MKITAIFGALLARSRRPAALSPSAVLPRAARTAKPGSRGRQPPPAPPAYYPWPPPGRPRARPGGGDRDDTGHPGGLGATETSQRRSSLHIHVCGRLFRATAARGGHSLAVRGSILLYSVVSYDTVMTAPWQAVRAGRSPGRPRAVGALPGGSARPGHTPWGRSTRAAPRKAALHSWSTPMATLSSGVSSVTTKIGP